MTGETSVSQYCIKAAILENLWCFQTLSCCLNTAMKLPMQMTNKRVFASTANCETDKIIRPLLHEWFYSQEGKDSSLNLNQDLLIHMST